MSDIRKINFYEISVTNDLDCRSCIDRAMDQTIAFNKAKAPERQKPTSNGGLLQVLEISTSGQYYNCKAKVIRDEFPGITDKRLDTEEMMDAENDPDKGIHEETHFVISLNKTYAKPIIAIESSMKGAKYNDIHKYLEAMLIHSGGGAEFNFEPVYAFNYDEFLQRISDVAQIKMRFYREDIEKYSEYDPTTGVLLRAAMQFGDPEYLQIEFGINFQKTKNRYNTDGLIERVKHFVNIFKKNPEAKDYIKKLDVNAEDRNFSNKLRLFDLIESKVASEVPAERKRPRSQYYYSTSLYESIRAQIEKDFGA